VVAQKPKEILFQVQQELNVIHPSQALILKMITGAFKKKEEELANENHKVVDWIGRFMEQTEQTRTYKALYLEQAERADAYVKRNSELER
jgi:hypothetical protein